MNKKIRHIIMALLLVVFCTAGGVIFFTYQKYEQEDRVYEQAAEAYTRPVTDGGGFGTSDASGLPTGAEAVEEAETLNGWAGAPLEVDFPRLREVNGDVVGWIYCEGTVINYPVLQGEDNDYYLHRNMNRQTHNAGSIFVDAANQPGFGDSNTIIYGHHMKNGSMFASLDEWAAQEYYEEHPVMWLLTPQQNYRILLFAGYTTSAASDTYTIFPDSCDELEEYLKQCMEKSDFEADFNMTGPDAREEISLSRNDQYVVLSTCAYSFQDARYVLHGKLVPVP
ncbi:class B sortase [Acetatifactor muris]|uniref:class B sortase n=1 Tax=Acetatifactor muris TaxID=879566 RepID=UPI0023F1B7D3|nr:class B sortase [Acetatifactor muris]